MSEDQPDRFDRIETALEDIRTRLEAVLDEPEATRATLREDAEATLTELETQLETLRARSEEEFGDVFDEATATSEEARAELETRIADLEGELTELQETVDEATLAEATDETKGRLREAIKRAEDGLARLRKRLR